MREKCKAYLKQYMLNTPVPGSDYKPTEEDWNRMPPEVLETMVDMVMGFHFPGYPEIIKEYEKKHTDAAFGLIVKNIIKKNK